MQGVIIHADTKYFYRFHKILLKENITFDCVSLGDQDVDLWVSVVGPDGNLIQTYCSSFINVQDNNNACQGQKDVVDVTGNIFTEELEQVENIEVILDGSPLSEMTDTDGLYAFNDMPTGGDYVINPYSNYNPLQGVNTLDLLEIQRHILGLGSLDSEYKIIAADANKDGSISGQDLLELRKLILGIYNELPNNDSWRFIDNNYTFIDNQDPLAENFN